jgi:hypothetical protein
VRNSSRSSAAGALTVLLGLLSAGRPSAHRLDEYLQAARLAIDPNRVEIALDLTPGIAIAQEIVTAIDRDANGSIAGDEARAFADDVLRAIALDLDGVPLHLALVDSAVPAIDAVLRGDGAVRIRAAAPIPPVADGRHRLRFRNHHRADIGVYLANTLVPASDRVAVVAQRRNVDQRDLVVDYNLRGEPATRVRQGLPVGVAGALVVALQVWWRRRPRESAR